ncbi:hypothetical protein NET02_03375 [Thermomicrobiaceae bacterium CFH 74404]|uniref:Uncharacterized protein n=1 Tax=Thermalbibacter longus TaxID=2951981 RepID=A0AA41WEY5_9BACT|nr:hypothetical protein [Thermalbibacter longus]MCM8748176.1 hypothetical protein [Thermalbibacter longus]
MRKVVEVSGVRLALPAQPGDGRDRTGTGRDRDVLGWVRLRDPDEVHGDTRLSWAAMGALALGLANGVAAGTMLSCPRRTWVWGLAALVAGVGTGLGMVWWGSVATLHLAVTEGRPAFAWARMSSLPLVFNALLVLYPWLAALVLLGAARGGSRRVAARDRAAQ